MELRIKKFGTRNVILNLRMDLVGPFDFNVLFFLEQFTSRLD